MTAQLHNRFVICVVVVEFAVNGHQALCCKIFVIGQDQLPDNETSPSYCKQTTVTEDPFAGHLLCTAMAASLK